MLVHSKEWSTVSSLVHGIAWKKDPIFTLAKSMVDETPTVSANIDRNELRVFSIIMQLTFTKTNNRTDDEPRHSPQEYCIVNLGDPFKRKEIGFYGHSTAGVINKQNGKEREFLLLSQELDAGEPGLWCALMLIDRNVPEK